MATPSSSSSSSSSETEVTTGRIREISETSRETGRAESHRYTRSPSNTIDRTSLADTTTLRTASPAGSHISGGVGRTVYDTVTTETTTTTAGGVPIIRPPISQQPGTGVGVFGPQVPGGYPTQPPFTGIGGLNQQGIQIDVGAAQQQYQQRNFQPEISPYSGSTISSSGGSLSSPGIASIHQQPHFDVAGGAFNQANLHNGDTVVEEEVQTWTQTTVPQVGVQFQQQQLPQQQQARFANQIPAHHVYNELLGPDAFKDVILDIDYGAMGGFNTAFQSGGDFFGGQLPPGINVRPAYTTVDSLNYQQHMFNTPRTINVGGGSHSYDYGGANSGYNFGGANGGYDVSGGHHFNNGGGQHFDAAKAMFNQADVNRDGRVSREEFQHWAQGGPSYPGGYPTNTGNYGNMNGGFHQGGLFAGGDPAVEHILQQSGLGQVFPHQ